LKKRGLVGLAALTGVVGLGVSRTRRRMRLIEQVPAPLRRRGLYLPIPITNKLILDKVRVRRSGTSRVQDGVTVNEVALPGTDATLFTYDSGTRQPGSGALIWIHGGGFISGTAGSAHDFCSQIAAEQGVYVVNVDYRLAPEHPFPAGFDDCYDALLWLHVHAAELGVVPNRIVVSGASAGGGLAAAVAQRAGDEGVPLAFQLLIYPMLDDRSALRRDLPALTWSAASNRYAWAAYLGHPAGQGEDRPYAVPARRWNLKALAPAWIAVGDVDLFHEEVEMYAARLQAHGVDCHLQVEQGMYHGADAAVPGAPEMQRFRSDVLKALESVLAKSEALAQVH
jgi:acetyl esterase/lipase